VNHGDLWALVGGNAREARGENSVTPSGVEDEAVRCGDSEPDPGGAGATIGWFGRDLQERSRNVRAKRSLLID
jgi:hypothetical protein